MDVLYLLTMNQNGYNVAMDPKKSSFPISAAGLLGPDLVFSLATNVHWFSMPDGHLSLVTVGLVDQRPTQVNAMTFQLILSACPGRKS